MKLPVEPYEKHNNLLPPDTIELFVLIQRRLDGGHACRQFNTKVELHVAFDKSIQQLSKSSSEYRLEAYRLDCDPFLLDGITLLKVRTPST